VDKKIWIKRNVRVQIDRNCSLALVVQKARDVADMDPITMEFWSTIWSKVP